MTTGTNEKERLDMRRHCLAVAVVALLIFLPAAALAAPITLNGLTFSEVSGAFTITGGTAGAGTQADPIVLYETVTGLDVTMSIRGFPQFGDPVYDDGYASFWLQKVVTNDTGADWNYYDHELQQVLGTPSSDGDGLSFAQGLAGRPWTSDVFSVYDEVTDVRDYINFSRGVVHDGDTVTFNYIVHDFTPEDIFYLRQRPNYSLIPEPGTLALLGIGLAGVALLRRRRR
jgi:hypothetical protein